MSEALKIKRAMKTIEKKYARTNVAIGRAKTDRREVELIRKAWELRREYEFQQYLLKQETGESFPDMPLYGYDGLPS